MARLCALAVALASIGTLGCAPHLIRASHAVPLSLQGPISNIPRIWVAGFIVNSNAEFDVNLETTRLLRTWIRERTSVPVVDAEPLAIRSAQVFADAPYWRRLGEEHGCPLIVTGSVRLLLAPPQMVQRGLRTMYLHATGRILEATVVVIDGKTGEILSRTELPARTRYGIGRGSSGLTLYFQLMDRAMDDWFRAMAEGSPATTRRTPPQITQGTTTPSASGAVLRWTTPHNRES
jgi:hypothetical protein